MMPITSLLIAGIRLRSKDILVLEVVISRSKKESSTELPLLSISVRGSVKCKGRI